MGFTHVDGAASGPAGSEAVRFLLDSGASYTVLPLGVWTAIGATEARQVRLRRADGTELNRGLGECRLALTGYGEVTTPVILGERNDLPLLGSLTLAELALMLDPLSRALRPMRALLPSVAPEHAATSSATN